MFKALKSKLTVLLVALTVLSFAFGFATMPKNNVAFAEEVTAVFEVEQGAGLNVANSNYKAIRWTATMNEEFYNSLETVEEEGKKVFGIAVTPAYEGKTPEEQEVLTKYFEYKGNVSFVNGEFIYATNITYDEVIDSGVENSDQAYDLPLLARPYYKTANGTVVFGAYADTVRSATGIAAYYLATGAYAVGSTEYTNLIAYVPGFSAEKLYTENRTMLPEQLVEVTANMANVDRVFFNAVDVTSALDGNTVTIAADSLRNDADGDNVDIIFKGEDGSIEAYYYYFATVYANGVAVAGEMNLAEPTEITVSLGNNWQGIQQFATPVSIVPAEEGVVSVEGNVITAISNVAASTTLAITFENTWGVLAGQQFTANLKVNVSPEVISTLDKTFTFSAVDGLFFDGSEVISLADVAALAGIENVSSAKTADGKVLEVVDGKVLGLTGLSNSEATAVTITLYGTNGALAVSVNAATLVIDEAEDFKYFTYTGSFDPSTLPEGATTATKRYTFSVAVYNEDQMYWDGYFMLVKDVDASSATYGTNENRHYVSGSAVTGAVAFTSARITEANKDVGVWGDETKYNIFNTYGSNAKRGFNGTLDGNGYVLSNFYTSADGLFGALRIGSVVKNLGLVGGSTKLASLAYGATIDNLYVDMRTTNAIVTSANTATTISNALIVNNGTLATYTGVFGAYENDYNNVASNTMANFDNVIIVSKFAINHGYAAGSDYNHGAIRAEAATVDGVVSTGKDTISWGSKAAYEGSIKYANEYSYRIVAGATRYTTLAKMIEAGKAEGSTLYDGFTSDCWQVVDGRLMFASSIESILSNVAIYKDGEAAVGGDLTFNLGDKVTFSAVITDGTTSLAKPVTVTATAGSDYVTIDGGVVTFDKVATEVITLVVACGDAQVTYNYTIGGITVEGEFLFSAYDGLFFNADGDVVSLDEITGVDGATLTAATDKDDNNILVDGAISGVKGDKAGLVENKFDLTVNGVKYAVNVKVATLVIDEAKDLEYFTYHGSFTTTDAISDATQKAFATWLSNAKNGEQNEFMWNGYYVMVDDIDGAAEGYVHNKMGDSGITQMVFASTPDAEYFAEKYYNLAAWSAQHNPWYRYYGRGFSGTFDGNGHTISNLTTDRQGLFGILVEGATVKNVALVEVGANDTSSALAEYALGATISDVYFNNASTNSGFIKSSTAANTAIYDGSIENATVISNVVLEYSGSINTHSSNVQKRYTHLLGPANASNGQDPTAAGIYADLNNVVIVSWASPAVKMGDGWSGAKVWTDCAYLDGVANGSTSTAHFANNGTPKSAVSAYTIYTLGETTQRFTSVAKMAEAYNANNDIFAGFTSDIWSISNGRIFMASAVKALFNQGKIFVDGVESTGADLEVALNDTVTFTGALSDGNSNVAADVKVTATAGAEFVTIEGGNVTFNGLTTDAIVIVVTCGNATATFNFAITGVTIAEEYNYSAADGVFFTADGEAKTLAEVVGLDVAELTAATDVNGKNIFADGAISGVASSKEGLVSNQFTLTINGIEYKVNVKVATLILDEAEDFKYFTYKGAFVPAEGVTAGSNGMISSFAKTAFTERALTWTGYYMLAKDIDASTATYGTAENPHILSGSATIGSIVKATSVRWQEANLIGNWKNEYYLYSPYYKSTFMAGFKGVLDGNSHTVSNFKISADGLFGQIYGGTIKNLGWVNSGSLATLASNAIIDNSYFYTDYVTPIIKSANVATVVSNSMIVNTSPYAVYGGVFGVYNVDETNISSTYGTMATFENVVIVSNRAINHGYNSQSNNYSFGAIRFDAGKVDGVEVTGSSNVVYGVKSTVEATSTVANAYTYGVQTGASRYTSAEKMVEIYNADNTIYDAFTGSVWSVVDGVLTFGA